MQDFWIFGYGSLIWRPDFPFLESRPGNICHWSRRFWQGSHDHRGTENRPGRVLTLIASEGERCHGRAFRVTNEVLAHLDLREKNGYERHDVSIQLPSTRVAGIVYIAGQQNAAFLGDAPLEVIADQICQSEGPSGSNVEYLTKLAEALKDLRIEDDHIFRLDAMVRNKLGLCTATWPI